MRISHLDAKTSAYVYTNYLSRRNHAAPHTINLASTFLYLYIYIYTWRRKINFNYFVTIVTKKTFEIFLGIESIENRIIYRLIFLISVVVSNLPDKLNFKFENVVQAVRSSNRETRTNSRSITTLRTRPPLGS